MAYGTINDVINEVIQTLGDNARDFDAEGIAREVSEWRDGELVASLDRPDYWDIVQAHAKGAGRGLRYELNASYMHFNGDSDGYYNDYYGEFVSVREFDTKDEAMEYALGLLVDGLTMTALITDMAEHGADGLSLDVRPVGPNGFVEGYEVYPDGSYQRWVATGA